MTISEAVVKRLYELCAQRNITINKVSIISGVTMLSQCGLDQRNTLIAATSLSIGIGVTLVSGFFDHMPKPEPLHPGAAPA